MSHIHAIFNHKGQNLLKTEKISLEYSDKNEFTHLYTLHVKPDGTYEVFFDLESKAKGNLVDDWDFPKKTIDDPDDKKPDDWVDETEIDDPADKKPEGYDDIPAQVRPRPLRSPPSAPTPHTRPLAPSHPRSFRHSPSPVFVTAPGRSPTRMRPSLRTGTTRTTASGRRR